MGLLVSHFGGLSSLQKECKQHCNCVTILIRIYRPVSLTLMPGKFVDRITLSALTGHVKDIQGIRPS